MCPIYMYKDKFYSLPVGQGDSFLLVREKFCALVDGGSAERGLLKRIDRLEPNRVIDVVICTQNDADHAKGIIGLLSETGIQKRIGQVWLPGNWTYRLSDLLVDAGSFLQELDRNIREFSEKHRHIRRAEIEAEIEVGGPLEKSPSEIEAHVRALDNAAGETTGDVDFSRFKKHGDWVSTQPISPGKEFTQAQASLWRDAILAADRIHKIYTNAIKAGIPVKWFDYEAFINAKHVPSGGLPGILEPVNSREVNATTVRISALHYLYLTKSNRESLVFYSPENAASPGVLFSSESLFDFPIRQSPPRYVVIATVPHHGAEANAVAYGPITKWTGASDEQIWVRSDSKNEKRPCKDYIDMLAKKYCTVCTSTPKKAKQVVSLQAASGTWTATKNTRDCNCT